MVSSMKKVLVTGGTVFVSKFIANYFKNNAEVYVLNRNTKKQLDGVHLIQADRKDLNGLRLALKGYSFDAVIDVCAYSKEDVNNLLDALENVNCIKDYVLISSSAVYPETNKMPFNEEQKTGANKIWTSYGLGKVEAENALLNKKPFAYILRPPYLYGAMQNVYREPFVFECALKNRAFYIPKNGELKLQFFDVEDLCHVIKNILEVHPKQNIFNVGNEQTVSINDFVSLCYEVAGKTLQTVNVYNHNCVRDYFCFYDYEYVLDVTKQKEVLQKTKDLKQGLQESFEWYIEHKDDVAKKPYIDFIDKNLV